MKAAIKDACSIYRRRVQSSLSPEESVSLIEGIRHKIINIDHFTQGAHALVWTYFIAAAKVLSLNIESSLLVGYKTCTAELNFAVSLLHWTVSIDFGQCKEIKGGRSLLYMNVQF